MSHFLNNVLFFFLLFNPFLMSIYLIDLIKDVSPKRFSIILLRATIISSCVFIPVALIGEPLFDRYLFARFSSFQIFGGIVFVVIGLRFMFHGADSIRKIRGPAEHVLERPSRVEDRGLLFYDGRGSTTVEILHSLNDGRGDFAFGKISGWMIQRYSKLDQAK